MAKRVEEEEERLLGKIHDQDKTREKCHLYYYIILFHNITFRELAQLTNPPALLLSSYTRFSLFYLVVVLLGL